MIDAHIHIHSNFDAAALIRYLDREDIDACWLLTWEEVQRRGVDIVVALDVSDSMLVEDVESGGRAGGAERGGESRPAPGSGRTRPDQNRMPSDTRYSRGVTWLTSEVAWPKFGPSM